VPHSPFTDQARIRGDLYASTTRLDQRSGTLHAAKIAGADLASAAARCRTSRHPSRTSGQAAPGRATSDLL
jgi:hypothetical protein